MYTLLSHREILDYKTSLHLSINPHQYVGILIKFYKHNNNFSIIIRSICPQKEILVLNSTLLIILYSFKKLVFYLNERLAI